MRSWVHHYKIRPQGQSTYQFIVKRLNRSRPQHRLRRCQINQVVGVNHERAESEFAATIAETDAWLDRADPPAALRRLVTENRDDVARELRCRERDARGG